uniref:Uncharacterized protein n=1 Tax=Tanacetum cinerariifolium TaxID=118510 RepID=A0A6L2NYS1_TANCI|nr:hypothetical protein [Tanacetum cinerariifolium]
MSSLADNVLAVGAENRPLMLEKGEYDTWKSRMMLYIEGKEHGQMLLDSILKVDGLEGFDSDYEELQLHATSIPMTENIDAYDSEVDDALTANAIFIAKLSPDGSINEDEVGSSYDSDILSEVPNYETYHENDMFNPFVQELLVSKQLVSVNGTYVDFLSDSNVISDNPYPDNNEKKVAQEMASLTQNNVAILLLTENTQHEVTHCNTVNLESKQINEQLTIELEKYTKQVKVLESKKKNQLVFTFTKKDLDSQMQKLIVGYNHNDEALIRKFLS